MSETVIDDMASGIEKAAGLKEEGKALESMIVQFGLAKIALEVALRNKTARDCGKASVEVVEIPACVAQICIGLIDVSAAVLKKVQAP